MNAGLLLQHFERLSEATDAIPRLRRFILDLAVRGKLVEQDPNDEPAVELLERITREKAQLVKAGEIRKPPVLKSINDAETPFALPSNWVWVRVGDIFDYDAGVKRNPDELFQDRWLLELEDIEKDTSTVLARLRVNDRASQSTKSEFEVGDILYGKLRPYLNKVVVADEPGYSTTEIVAIRPYLKLCSGYCALAFRRPDFVAYVERLGRGTKMPRLRTPDAIVAAFPLPPLAEQHRIVAKVDELMALCDRLESAQEEREGRRNCLVAASVHRLNNGVDADAFREDARFYFNHLPSLTTRPTHMKQLRQTILNLAVRGKLVPQDPSDEPASELLKRIQAEKVRLVNEGTIKRLQPALPIGAEEIPSAVPDGWEWVRISDLLLGDTQNGYSKKPDDAFDGIPILRISAGTVRKDGVVAEEEHKLIGGVSAAQQEQYRLQPGDLLACRFNGNRSFVGRLTIYLGYLGLKPIYPDKLIRLRLLLQFTLPKLVQCFAESSVVRRDIESYCATTVGNWGISASNLKEIKIPLPPLAEQHRIVAKVDELMALCDQLESQLTITETDSRRLLEAVVHDAVTQAQGTPT